MEYDSVLHAGGEGYSSTDYTIHSVTRVSVKIQPGRTKRERSIGNRGRNFYLKVWALSAASPASQTVF